MSELKTPVSTTIKYKDGSETVIHYNEIGEKMSEEIVPVAEESVPEQAAEAPAEVSVGAEEAV